MALSEYELGLVNEAKKGKKKSLDRLYDACHKQLCNVVEGELGDRSRAETILQAVFEKIKVQIKSLDNPAMFEQMAIRMTIEECKNYPKSDKPSGGSGASQFAAYESSKSKEEKQSKQDPLLGGFVAGVPAETSDSEKNYYHSQQKFNPPVQQQQTVQQQSNVQQQQTVQQPPPVHQQQMVQQQPNVQQKPPVRQQPPKEPIVAWLVCVNGMDRGATYPVRDKLNLVGSSPVCDIQVHGEQSVLPENHACIAYDRDSTACLLYPGAAGAVNLNGIEGDYAQPLNKFDIITFGNAQFVFAPFDEGLEWKSQFGL